MKSVKSVSRNSVAGLPADVQGISALLADEFSQIGADAELFLVGGIVRDVLLGAPLGRDLDFATSLLPPQTERALHAAGGAVFKIGEKFGTIGAIFSGTLDVEVTTYRAEAYRSGSRKPAVAFGRALLD